MSYCTVDLDCREPIDTTPLPEFGNPEANAKPTAPAAKLPGDHFVSASTPSSGLDKTLRSPKGARPAAETDPARQRQAFADQAMLLALNAEREKTQLQELKKLFVELRDGSPEQEQDFLAALNGLGHRYLQFGAATFSNPEDSEKVKAELNHLAATCFELAAELADRSPHAEIKKQAPLYNGYRFLTEGDIEAAKNTFEKIRQEFPEADAILKQMDADRLKLLNLGALDAWEVSIGDHEASWQDQDKSLLGRALGKIVDLSHSDGKTHVDDFQAKLNVERELVKEVRKRIQEGKAPTIHEALVQIGKEDRKDFQALAQDLVQHEDALNYNGSFFLSHLIQYASTLEHAPNADRNNSNMAESLFRDMEQLQARYGAVQTSYAVVSILQATSADAAFQKDCGNYLDELEHGKDLAGVIGDMVKTIGTDDLLQVAMMAGASKLGSLTKLATLARLQRAGITGYKAIAIAYTAETLAEGTALWAMNTAHEALVHDTSKVFTAEHLAKSYGANLIMIGGLKAFGAAGQTFSPRVARALGLVADGGAKLSQAGELLAWGLGHFAGLSGMVATTQLNQGLGLAEAPKGGLQESLVRDLFTYVKFGIAQRGVGAAFGEKSAAAHRQLHEKIAVKQFELTAEAAVKQLGFKPLRRSQDGLPVFAEPAGQELFGQLLAESLRRPGFNAGKLASLLQKKNFSGAKGYLKGFGLRLTGAGTSAPGLAEVNPKVEELLARYAKLQAPQSRLAKLGQGLKALALSPAMMFLGAGGLGAGFPYILPEAPQEAAFVQEVLEEAKRTPGIVSEIYYSATDGETAAIRLLGELAKSRSDAFYYLDNLVKLKNETAKDVFKNFPVEALSPKLDTGHAKYLLATCGNEKALADLVVEADENEASRQMLGWLAEDGDATALAAIGRLAPKHNEALLNLCTAALSGNTEALPLMMKAVDTNPNRVFATMHKLVHQQKSEAAREVLKNISMKDLPWRAKQTDWLYLMAECGNHGAVGELASQAPYDGNARHTLMFLVREGSAEALRQVGELAKSDNSFFREIVRLAEEKHAGAKALLKSFSAKEVPGDVDAVDRLYTLAKFENGPALQALFQRAQDGSAPAIRGFGMLAYHQATPKTIRLLGVLAKHHSEAVLELKSLARMGNQQAQGQLWAYETEASLGSAPAAQL